LGIQQFQRSDYFLVKQYSCTPVEAFVGRYAGAGVVGAAG